ncbi:MAG: HEAT repeat domain-containing protein [Planctomycetota bacterium]
MHETSSITGPGGQSVLVWMYLILFGVAAGPATTPAAAGPIQDAEPRAVQVLLDASRSDRALLRMNAIEGAKAMPDRALPMVQLALDDPNPAVRFAALVTAGRLQLEGVGRRAQRMSADPEQPDYVRAAAIFAAHRTGHKADLGRLAEMMYHPDLRQRSNAALLFGLTEDPSVIPVLKDAAQQPMWRAEPLQRELVRIQIAEALLNLGEEDSLKAIQGAAYSSDDEVRVLAVIMLGRAGDRSMRGNLTNFLAKDPVELRLAAAEALARIGSGEGLPVMLESAEMPRPTVRAQAAFALGQLADNPRAAAALLQLLDDADPVVRVAAAAAVLDAIHR